MTGLVARYAGHGGWDQAAALRSPYAQMHDEGLIGHFARVTRERCFPIEDHSQTTADKLAGVMENRFDLVGETHAFQGPIDWLANPSADLEWQILLHKFYFSVGLGSAYGRTGERGYLDKWIELTTSWMDRVQPDLLAGRSLLNSELFVAVTGRRLQNWIYAYTYFVHAPAPVLFADGFHRRFLGSVQAQTEQLIQTVSPARNHRTIELAAIFLASVTFPELEGARRWLEFSSDALWDNIRDDLLPDGVQCELSTDYHHLVLRNYLSVLRLARMNGITAPRDVDERLRCALHFSLHVHKPDGTIPSLSDGDVGDYRALLRQGHELFDDPSWLYGATAGKQGRPPRQRSALFADAGYVVLRSGWGETDAFKDERYLVFDCGPLGEGNHGHLDVLSIEMAAYGRSLIVDPGRYTYSEAGSEAAERNWRVLFRGTSYHNTVLIDGRNQTRYAPRPKRPGRPDRHSIQGPAPDFELRDFVSLDGFDYLHGVARSHEYEVVHERRVFFLGGAYWVVCDRLLAAEAHDYRQLFHLAAEAQDATSVEHVDGTVMVRAPGLLLAQPARADVAARLEQGFVSREYGEKQPAPIVSFDCRADTTSLLTVLHPYAGTAPRLFVRTLPVRCESAHGDAAGAAALEIVRRDAGRENRDIVFIGPDDGAWRRFGDWCCDGSWLALRLDGHGGLRDAHHTAGTRFACARGAETAS
ncbi:MAG: alginate lyase family protein [Alphaproteobacteria bacterium]